MKQYSPGTDIAIDGAVVELSQMVNIGGVPATMRLNDVTVVAYPGTTAKALLAQWTIRTAKAAEKLRSVREYLPKLGDHIDKAAAATVHMAGQYGEPVSLTFNGITAVAQPGTTARQLVTEWEAESDRAREAYENSPEGRRAKREREEEAAEAQYAIDTALRRLNILDFEDLEQVLQFFNDLCLHDSLLVTYDRREVVEVFKRYGYVANANTGDQFDGEDRENYARYLIGQALDNLSVDMSVHDIYTRFYEQWKTKFASGGPVDPKV